MSQKRRSPPRKRHNALENNTTFPEVKPHAPKKTHPKKLTAPMKQHNASLKPRNAQKKGHGASKNYTLSKRYNAPYRNP